MDKISALFDGVWTTMEDWGAATTFNYGIAVLIPILIVLVLALVTKDTFVSFFAGIIAAFLMAAKGHPLVAVGLFMDQVYVTLCDDGTQWVLLVCGVFGGLLQLMPDS